jgi:hypothetical protein
MRLLSGLVTPLIDGISDFWQAFFRNNWFSTNRIALPKGFRKFNSLYETPRTHYVLAFLGDRSVCRVAYGIIGCDTSHSVAFTELINDSATKGTVPGMQSGSCL